MRDPRADAGTRDETLTKTDEQLATALRERVGDGTLAIAAGAGALFLAGRASDGSPSRAWAGAVVGAALLGYGVRKRLAFVDRRDESGSAGDDPGDADRSNRTAGSVDSDEEPAGGGAENVTGG